MATDKSNKRTRQHVNITMLKKRIGNQWLEMYQDIAPELDEACAEFPEHVPCPMHGGNDGFRLFNDAESTGGGVCNTCGAFSDGISLLQKVKGWTFKETVEKIEAWLDGDRDSCDDDEDNEEEEQPIKATAVRQQDSQEINQWTVAYIKDIGERAESNHERIRAYYRSRGLSVEPPDSLGFVEEENYYDKETGSLTLPAMLAVFQDANGEPVAVMRTYLDPNGDGKACVPTAKKCTPPVRKGATMGTAIHLRDIDENQRVLGVSEGIETAEAVFQATGTPTCATCAANRLEKLVVPSGVHEVQIWGDNDTSGTGQRAAMKLAERLLREGFQVKVLLPPEADNDWLDVLNQEGEEALRNALAEAPYLEATMPVPMACNANLPAVATEANVIVSGTLARTGDPVTELNKKHFVVPIGGKTHVATESVNPETSHISLELGSVKDVSLRYSNRKVQVEEGKNVPVVQLWLECKERREYDGVVFSPGRDVPGYYNLWTGFTVEPRQGDCSLFWQHLLTIICRGNEAHFDYVKKWLAHMILHPAELPEVALVIRGSQGTGKTIFIDFIGDLLGQHYLMLNRMEQLTGRFTGHLKDALLVYANESVWGGDKQGEGALKSMITDAWCTIEAKGKDLYKVRNYKRLIVSSNERWAVPMAMDDRRFLILEASDEHKEDRGYFAALHRQMKQEGGLQALLYDLQHENLSDFDVRSKPQSNLGFDIKLRSAEPIVRWWYERLYEGSLPCSSDDLDNVNDWNQQPITDILHLHFLNYCTTHRQRTIDISVFGKEFRKLLPGCSIGGTRPIIEGIRERCYILPLLEVCREAFQRYANAGPEIWE